MGWRDYGDVSPELWRSVIEHAGGPPELAGSAAWAAAGKHKALALAMLGEESSYGTRFNQNRPENRNPLNLRPPNGDGYMDYPSWVDGVQAWHDRLTDPTYKNGVYQRTTTVRELVDVYAPSSDNNRPAEYTQNVLTRLERWGIVGGTNVAVTKPVIHDLATDYALYGLTQDEASILLSKKIVNRAGFQPQGIVFHIQDGQTRGSLRYWVGVQASSTVMINKDGSVLNIIPRRDGPWTNGDTANPTERGHTLVSLGGGDANRVSITCEMEGVPGDELTPAQKNAAIWWALDVMREFPHIDINDIYQHADINRVTRPNCADGYYPGLVAEIRDAITGPPPRPKPTIPWIRGEAGLGTINGTPVLKLVGEATLVADTTSRYGASTKTKAFKRYTKGQKVTVVGSLDSGWSFIDAGDGAFPRVASMRLTPSYPKPKDYKNGG